MEEFVSEVIRPGVGQSDSTAMSRGEPGLPREFTWRGQTYQVIRRLEQWKDSAPEGGKAGGELYLRRHYYKLQMSDDSMWTVYFVRQPLRGSTGKNRWYLYKIAQP